METNLNAQMVDLADDHNAYDLEISTILDNCEAHLANENLSTITPTFFCC